MAITDHDTLNGARKIAAKTDLIIIPGIEVSSTDGHIIGLNVKEPVAGSLGAQETIDRIHNADGIAVACHPFGLFKGGLGNRTTSTFDAVEVINSSSIPFNYAVKKSNKIASRLAKPRLAGSDAHYGPEIGYAYTVVDAQPNVDDVVKAISKGLCQPLGRGIPLNIRFRRILEVNRKRLESFASLRGKGKDG